jgi:sugar transferase (PEP-CTERM/EpsH1 system associated)
VKELLFLAHRIPYPPTKGDKIRSFHILKQLAQRYRVHLGAFIDDPRDWRYVAALQSVCADTCFVGLRPTWSRLRSMGALARGEPLTLAYYRNRKLQSWVDALLARDAIERIFVFSSSMAQYVESFSRAGVRRVLDFVDMDSDKWRQYSLSRAWPLSAVYAREAARLFAYERNCANRFDAAVFVSEAEARLFREQAPETAARVSAIENGVDIDYFSPAREYANPYRAEERALVFTGAMDYWANVDAVVWFAREVFPRVRAAVPTASFYIVGARPTRAVAALASSAGVRVTGAVEDVRPYLAHARAAVAPLRIARGVQNKVLEAMAMGRAIIASAQAADGLRLAADLSSIVCRDADSMAARAQQLLSEGDRDGVGARGREWVARHYRWNENLARLEALLEGDTPSARARAHAAAS